MNPIHEIYPQLAGSRKIAITMHQKPDADAMGSALALTHYLRALGNTVTVVSPTNWANWLNWMPAVNEVIDFEKNREDVARLLESVDWLFCLDFNIFHRTKNLAPLLASLKCSKILIDHHREPDAPNFDYGISDTGKSSTCEMVYDFIMASGGESKLDLTIAECIYAGVVADTGSFRFSSTTADVHKMVAHLMSLGLEHTRIHSALFDNFLENRLRFIGHILSNRMEVMYEYNVALIMIPKGDLLRYHIRTGDTEGLVNYPLSIQGIKMAALVIDRDEERKWSFRSKGDFDCNTFARNYFEGGGHFSASGGRSSESLQDTVSRFKKIVAVNKSLFQ